MVGTQHPSTEHEHALATAAEGFRRAEAYVRDVGMRGYDPYDALTSPLFRLPGLRSSRLIRRGSQQLLRRVPINVRPLLGIRPGLSPVTVALVLQAMAYDEAAGQRADVSERSAALVTQIADLRSHGWSGSCWGYEFDWETRNGRVPAGTPTVVATGFVTNSLFAASELVGSEAAFQLCRSAAPFVLSDLNRTPGRGTAFCWSYSPLDHSRVLNASAKGSRLLAQVYSRTGDETLRTTARQSLEYVVAHQRPDGSWPYAVDDPRTWSDNFHTAYVLDALTDYDLHTGDDRFEDHRERGWRYYRSRFFEDDVVPRYYDTSTYPIDATSVAQSLLTLSRQGDLETAARVARFAVERMQRPNGSFVYRIHPHFVNRVPYMRWSTAWMLCGLARLLYAEATRA